MRFNFMALETLPVVIFIIRRKPKVYLLRKPAMSGRMMLKNCLRFYLLRDHRDFFTFIFFIP
jgi:hypothetical protein